jgi:hypothetical protein
VRANDEPAASWPGVLLDDRYRLDHVHRERTLPSGATLTLWRAVDEPLDRQVAVLVLTGADRRLRTRLSKAAATASGVADGRWVRVLDIGDSSVGKHPFTWVATEWVDGQSLATELRRSPLAPAVATELVHQCAEALAVADRDGCRHGRLHPDQVILSDTGLPRLTGLGIAAALSGDSAPTAPDDVRGLGGLLFAALTGCWPLSGWTGLPAAVVRGAHTAHPRRIRRAIPRTLDDVTARALTDGYADPAAVARALALLPRTALGAPAVDVDRHRRRRLAQRWAWRLVPPLVVGAVALTGWEFGSALGKVPTAAQAHRPTLPPASASAPGARALSLVWSTPPAVSSFDPEGDGQENPDQVALAVDRDPSTAWMTSTYRSSAFGGLKHGVGLLIDLGRPTSVRVAELALTAAGSDVEIRAGDRAPSQAADLTLVSSVDRAPEQLRATLDHPVTARYWLVWFTSLPQATGGYRIGVAEIALLG